MKNAIKRIYFLVLTLSISLVAVDSGLSDFVFSQNHIEIQRECTDSINNSDDSHLVGFEDEVLIDDFSYRYNNSLNDSHIIPLLDITFRNNFSSFVWQPPKHS